MCQENYIKRQAYTCSCYPDFYCQREKEIGPQAADDCFNFTQILCASKFECAQVYFISKSYIKIFRKIIKKSFQYNFIYYRMSFRKFIQNVFII